MHEKAYPHDYLTNDLSDDTHRHYSELITESIDQFGAEVFFVPMEPADSDNIDGIFQEIKNKKYTKMYGMRMALGDPTALTQASIYSKFGLSIDDEADFFIVIEEFRERILGFDYDHTKYLDGEAQDYTTVARRPMIGDLVWNDAPWKSLFVITWVELKESPFFGRYTFYKLSCKKYTARQDVTIALPPVGTGGDLGPLVPGGLDIMPAVDVVNTANQIEDAQTQKDPAAIHDTGFVPDNTNPNLNQTAEFEVQSIRAVSEDLFGEF